DAEARHEGQGARLRPTLREVEVVRDEIGVDAVIDVDDVEVDAEGEGAEDPAFVDAHVELVKSRETLAILRAVQAEVARLRAAVDAWRRAWAEPDAGRVEVAGHVTKARADFPAPSEHVAAEQGEDLRLIEVEQLRRLP